MKYILEKESPNFNIWLGVGIEKGSYYLCRERQIQREHVVSYLTIFTTLISLTVQSWYPTFNIFRSCFCPFVCSSVGNVENLQ